VPDGAAGKVIRVTVLADAPGATPYVVTLSSARVAPAPPAPAVAVKIAPQLDTLAPVAGGVVRVVAGDYAPAAAESYAWTIDGVAAGTGAVLAVPADAAGRTIRLTVTATAPGIDPWTGTLTTAPIAGPPPAASVVAIVAPQLSNPAPAAGTSVSILPGDYSPAASVTCQWAIDGVLAGTGTTLALPLSAAGKVVTATVTASASGLNPWVGTLTSAPVGAATPTPVPAVAAVVPPQLSTLAPVAGGTVRIVAGDYSPAAEEFYVWSIDGQFAGTGDVLAVPADAAGKVVRVSVTASAAGATPWQATLTAAPVVAVPPPPEVVVTVKSAPRLTTITPVVGG
jgi:hypothetical protein